MSSREAFEKLVVDKGRYVNREVSGEYFERDVALAWDAWKAATERAVNTASDEEHVVDSCGYYAQLGDAREQ